MFKNLKHFLNTLPQGSRPADPLWSLLPKGTVEGLAQNTPAKMLSSRRPPVVPFAKRDRGRDHGRAKRDRGWNHYRDSISVVPFAKRDRGTPHKRKRDRGWSHYLDSISVVPFAFMSCSVVPFAKRDRGNGAMIMVPTVVPFALLCSIAAKCSKLFERFAAKCSKIFGLCSRTWSSYFKCHAALGHHISSATALDE